MARYVLDAFALYAYFTAEPGGAFVRDLLRDGDSGEHEISVPMFNVGEFVFKVWQKAGEEQASEALGIIRAWPVEIVHADAELVLAAAALKAERRLGYLDCFPTALAIQRDAAVVTGDRGFAKVEDLVSVYWLPRA